MSGRLTLSSPKVPRIDLFPRSVRLKNGVISALDVGPSRHEEARSETRMMGPPGGPSVPCIPFPALLSDCQRFARMRGCLLGSRTTIAPTSYRRVLPRHSPHAECSPNRNARIAPAACVQRRDRTPEMPTIRHLPTRRCTWCRADEKDLRVKPYPSHHPHRPAIRLVANTRPCAG